MHLHHGVWAVYSPARRHVPDLPRAVHAAGEEKTALELPAPYGYRYSATDNWYLNYMIHNLTAKPFQVSLTYDVDFVPASSPKASAMKDVHPIWLDVQNGKIYPVFDVLQGQRHRRQVHLPRRRRRPYAGASNECTVPNDGVLVNTFGHLHPGGLYDDLHGDARRLDQADLHVEGASTTSPRARCRGTCR